MVATGPDEAGARRLGHDRRVVVGREPDHRLPRDRQARGRQTHRRFGHSRLGKTVLWASAKDERIAAVFSSCSGEMGAALARRDWGETVDDMAQNFAWQFAPALQQWAGRWNDMPVDAHMLIALSAPRPVFITGGTADQWADPVGMFKAALPPARCIGCSAGKISARPNCRRSIRRSRAATSAGTITPAVTRRRRPTGKPS